ncbi:MAG TPA: sigma-70 family RNA polymerase sigma factor [Nitrospiraceae bacterium]|nr:sigma-70 family RNA polymerase sigma factor [Nitrospiraceae bacterium]
MESPSGHVSPVIDPDLLALIAKGDRRAFGRLYDRSSSLLYALALRILEDKDEAGDLLQEVYTEVWCKIARYDAQRGSPIAWLVTLTRSRAIDRLRARVSKGHGRTHSIEDTTATELHDHALTPFEQRADMELRIHVSRALAELPEAQRQALELAYYEGLSHSEIAKRLCEPLGTVKTRIKLGMSKLKTTLRSCWE